MVFAMDAALALYLYLSLVDSLQRFEHPTYMIPNPIILLRYTFCFFSIFRFQNREVGYKARMTSTAETIASTN